MKRYYFGAVYQTWHVHRVVAANSEDEAIEKLERGEGAMIGIPNRPGDITLVEQILEGDEANSSNNIWGLPL